MGSARTGMMPMEPEKLTEMPQYRQYATKMVATESESKNHWGD